MKKLIQRLLLFFVGLPLIVASVFFFPFYNYLVLHIELLIFSVLAIIEMRTILSNKLQVYPLWITLPVGLLIPMSAFLYSVLDLPFRVITFSIAIAVVIILFIEFIVSFTGSFDKAIERLGSAFIILLYPGYLVMYLSIMTVWEHAGAILSTFFLMVFGCDSLAWFFGMLLGKNNRGLVIASPNKSIAGFIGGYIGSLGAATLSYYIFAQAFRGSIVKLFIIAVFTATASIVGDIIESILKRSSGVKDSGSVIPGRGGVLDSIDSILLAAPIFYILCDFFYGFS